MTAQLDARAWTAWTAATAVLTMSLRNPLYTLIIFLATQLVFSLGSRPANRLPIPFWRIGLIMLTFSALFNGLFVSVGGLVLWRLPDSWPLIGGPISLEAILFGLGNGFILWTLLAVFLAFNAIVPAHQLVRLTPPAFHDLGVVVLIALTYLPETTRHLQRVREAQAARGRRLRGWRDWRPLFLPLLIGGLERSMQLAETMVARGYGATQDVPLRGARWLIVAALLALLGGWLAVLWQRPYLGATLVVLAAVALALTLWRMGRRVKTTRYRPTIWQTADSLALAAAILPLALVWLPWSFVDQTTLYYSPYPAVAWPPFDPIIGLSLTLLALPAFLLQRPTTNDQRPMTNDQRPIDQLTT
jgi:energy-coupling factor transport system permease protein